MRAAANPAGASRLQSLPPVRRVAELDSPLNAMRTFIVFLLSCASVFGADGGIQVVSTSKTNAQTASITTKDVFTRDGQTNLVRDTKTKAGVVQIRIHRFYYGRSLVW